MMDVGCVQLIFFVSLAFAADAEALSGHTTTFWNETTEDVLQCVDWDIKCDVMKQTLTCCRYEVVPVLQYDEITTCAEGWLEDNNGSCSIAACRYCPADSFCLSNGTCTYFCDLKSDKTASSCECSPGMTGAPYCNSLDNTFQTNGAPIVILEKINRVDEKTLSKIRLYNETAWSNRNGFNRITIMVPHIYFPEVISSLHEIYKEQRNSAFVSFNKSESSHRGDSLKSLHTACSGNLTVRTDICTLSVFDRYLDHGDMLTINTRSIIYFNYPHYTLSNPRNTTQTFTASMTIGFDFQPPVHCKEKSCPFQQLRVSPEISKGKIHLEWNGWEDGLSGIKHYVLNVYKMTSNQAGDLREPNDPCFSFTTDQTNTDYLPSQPGVYAFLLIVEDNASNRNYARRFALYDNTSRIDITNTKKLYFSSASEESNYHWQSNNTFLSVCWGDHFVNLIHDKGHFLSKIVTDPVLVDNSTVIPTYDDREGKIKLTATPNARGIVRFEYVGPLPAEPNDGKPNTESWREIGQIAHESLHKVFTTARRDGSSEKVWIKAYDIMGHTAEDSTYVFFDSSPPTANGNKAILQKNIHSRKFSSRVTMEATDKDSGIYQIQWEVQNTVTGCILSSGFTAGNKTDDKAGCDSNIKGCRCAADGACYLFKHYLYIDHCHILMSNTELQTADLVLNIRVVNYALLTHNFTKKIGKATTLHGISQYSHPIDIHTATLSTDSVKIAWSFENNCYTRTGLRVAISRTGQQSSTFHDLRWNETDFAMMELLPGTDYVATFVIYYGNESSSSLEYSFTTETMKPETRYVVVIALLSLATFVLLLGLVVTLRKFRTIRSNKELLLPSHRATQKDKSLWTSNANGSDNFKKASNKKSSKLKIPGKHQSTVQYESEAYEDATNGSDIDDVYEDLDDAVGTPPVDVITDVKIKKLISEGSFAAIYVGTCNLSTKGQVQCAFKTHTVGVDEGQIQEYEEEANALIYFHRKHVIHSLNILQYYGFINEGQDLPSLVMEYCENGALGDWLVEVGDQAQVNDLENIVYGIASGMEYLVARKIYHGNLTSFNIFLNYDLEPKIKGIGERDHTEESIRWQAPETFNNKENPNEAADAWSYGVIMWEVFSQGNKPFGHNKGSALKAMVKSGHQLGQPELCSDAFNAVIVTCLQLDPASRPTFTYMVDAIKTTKGSRMETEIEEPGLYENTDTSDIVKM